MFGSTIINPISNLEVKDCEVEEIIANSFKNFHAKGLDYICIHRSKKETVKVYFLDGDVTKLPEVINPHDHRYNFNTEVLAGAYVDHVYKEESRDSRIGDPYKTYAYLTPLNGGNGFTEIGHKEVYLNRYRSARCTVGNLPIISPAPRIHTIQMINDQTVLMLRQFEDVLPLDVATTCYIKEGYTKPDTTGLYDKFTADELIARLKIIDHLSHLKNKRLSYGK